MIKKRRCISCSKIQNAEDMIKITKNYQTNEIVIFPDNKTFGRSIYICNNPNCIYTAFKKNLISKRIKKNIDEKEKENIKTVLNSLVVVQH